MNRLLAVKKRTWQESFEALQRYKAKHGDCLVPIHNYKEDLALGGWVNHQRSKKNKLTDEQRQKLESIGFAWSVRVRNKTWNVMIEALKKFKTIHGNLEVPEVYQADQKLADFVKEQRAKYHKGQLSAARLKQLEEIGLVLKEEEEEEEEEEEADAGFNWEQEEEEKEAKAREEEGEEESSREGANIQEDTVRVDEDDDDDEDEEDMIMYDNAFKQQYQKLVDFQIKFGHCRVPKFSRRGDTLGLWVSALRRKYLESGARGMEPRCLELLDELDFFDASQMICTKPASSRLKPSSEVKSASEGEASADEEEDEGNEGEDEEDDDLVSDNEASDLSEDGEEEEEDDEEEVDGGSEGDMSDAESKATSSTNKDDTDIEEETRVEESSDDGGKKRRFSDASAARRCNYRDERFMKQYNDLLDFKRTHGHCRVPQSKRFKTLGGWVNNLRVMYNRDPENGVRADRRKMLDEIGFIWNAGADRPGNDARWEEQYKNLVEFRNKFSHCRVPQTGPHRKLGRWVATQRALYVKDPVNGIRADRLKRLNEIEFTWDAKGFKGRHFYSIAAAAEKPSLSGSTTKAESSATESDDDGPVAAAQVEDDKPPPGVVLSAAYAAEAFRNGQIFAPGVYPPVPMFANPWSHPIPLPASLPVVSANTPNNMLPARSSGTAIPLPVPSAKTTKMPATAAKPPLVSPEVEAKPLIKQVSLD